MLEEDDKLEALVEQIKAPQTDERAKRAVASLVCAHAARGLDLDDEQQRRLAVVTAYDTLDALGLVGDPDKWTPSPTSAKGLTRFLHGTEGGVKAHLAAGSRLCKPCRRWREVDDRKHGVAFLRPAAPDPLGLCGTERRWLRHLDDCEALDPACAMYEKWRMSRMTGQPRGTGPLSQHVLDKPLPLHLDGTPCAHKLDRVGNALEEGCTGRAGWSQSCNCGWSMLLATQRNCTDMQQDHRRQVILRALAEAN